MHVWQLSLSSAHPLGKSNWEKAFTFWASSRGSWDVNKKKNQIMKENLNEVLKRGRRYSIHQPLFPESSIYGTLIGSLLMLKDSLAYTWPWVKRNVAHGGRRSMVFTTPSTNKLLSWGQQGNSDPRDPHFPHTKAVVSLSLHTTAQKMPCR